MNEMKKGPLGQARPSEKQNNIKRGSMKLIGEFGDMPNIDISQVKRIIDNYVYMIVNKARSASAPKYG